MSDSDTRDASAVVGGAGAHPQRAPPSLAPIADEFDVRPPQEIVGEISSSVAEESGDGEEAEVDNGDGREAAVVEISQPTRGGKWPPGVRPLTGRA